MSYLRRALWSVWNNQRRTLLLLLTLTIIATLVFTSLSLYYASDQAKTHARNTLGSEVRLEYDYEKSMKNTQSEGSRISTWPTIAMAQSLSGLDDVTDYNFLRPIPFVAGNFSAVNNETMTEDVEITFDGPAFELANVSVHQVLGTVMMKEFMDGTHTLISGRHITRDDIGKRLVLMESRLADKNNLSVGDIIEVKAEVTNREAQFEIVGIYKTEWTFGDITSYISTDNIQYNIMYGSFFELSAGEITADEQKLTIAKAMYYMDAPEHITPFVEAAHQLDTVDYETFYLNTNERALQTMTFAIDKVSSFSRIMLVLVFAAGAIILSLLLFLFIRSRKTEMGILLSLGESRGKIIAQLLTETLIVLFISLVFSLIGGGIISEKTSEQLLTRQVENFELKQETYTQGAKVFVVPNNEAEPIKKLDVQLTSPVLLGLGAVGVILTIIATIFPALLILRLHPKKILAD
ncbi:ABC transporter permease [Paenibacillus donghaensis]|uniref:ABC3 transporter permease C-terminal domain-containing protein n=1 Tax=Paenibacillus donghaensis TaxID=414771 RepID=A0A2Z2KRV8_9BACL|nr:ABC transporter permease [Paenibacillus donghaensis]ASA23231.1 hypothetical protein B9T62_21930 [Paenibacillus donghaensis]